AWMNISSNIYEDVDVNALVEGPLAKHLRRINIIYAIFTLVMVWLLCYHFTSSHVFSVYSMVFTTLFFISSRHVFDTLYSELLASFLLLQSSYFLLLFFSCKKHYFLLSILSGVSLGLLSLTKAALFYVILVA